MKKATSTIAGFLYFFMAIVAVALLMPTVREAITYGVNRSINSTHGGLLSVILTYWPLFFIVMLLIILVIVLRPK